MSTTKKRVTWSTDREPKFEHSQRTYRSHKSRRISRSPDSSRKSPSRSSEKTSLRRRSRSPEFRWNRRSRSPELRWNRRSRSPELRWNRRSRSPELRWNRRSRSPELRWNRRSRSPERSRTSSYDDYSSLFRSLDNYRRREDPDLTYKISKILDRKLERTDSRVSSSRYIQNREFSPNFRHPTNQPIYPWHAAFITCGCPFLNPYRRPCVGCESWNLVYRSSSAAVSNPQMHAANTRLASTCSVPTKSRLKSVVVKQKIQELLKRVSTNSDHKRGSCSKVLKPSKPIIVNKVLGTKNASASLSTCKEGASSIAEMVNKFLRCNKLLAMIDQVNHSSSKSTASLKSEILNKFLINNEVSAMSISNKNAQEDLSNNNYSFAGDDEDLIFLGIMDKNDLDKDVEVVVISDDENEDDDNAEGEDDLEEYVRMKLDDISSDDDFDQICKI